MSTPETISIARPDDGSVSADDIGKVNALGEKGDGDTVRAGLRDATAVQL